MSLIGTVASGLNISEQLVKLIGGAIGLAGAVILVLVVVDAIGDSREDKLRLDAAEDALVNRGVADGVDSSLEERDDASDDKLGEVIDDAASDDPEGADSATGPVTNAVADELRGSRASGRSEPRSD